MSNLQSEKTAQDFFDNEYLKYAQYVVSERAIPSVIDGFKPSQRKIAYAASKLWKTGNEKPMKVFQLGGQAAAISFFHHGSLDSTITGMTQEFKNSMPIFQGIGQFGSLRAPEAGAPRYIGVKLNENFRLLYKDEELLTPQYEEGEQIEPKYFLPIIPTVLLNGGSGIAVGFATNILNRDPVQLIDACLEVLQGKPIKADLSPRFTGFNGSVTQTQPKTWVFKGTFEVKNTMLVEITEIPPNFTFEKYESYLESLVEKGVLHSYEDNSSNGVRYLLKFPRATLADLLAKGTLGSLLKMTQQDTENLTTLDENANLKIFEKVEDIVDYFVNYRLSYYAKRKSRLLKELDKEITDLTYRELFTDAVVSGDVNLRGADKTAIAATITALGIPAARIDSLLALPIYSLTAEKIKEIKAKLAQKKAERDTIDRTAPKDFYFRDLTELRNRLTGGRKRVPAPTPPAPAATAAESPAEASEDAFDFLTR